MALLAATGLLMGLGFSRVFFGLTLPDFGWLGWIGLVPMVFLIAEASPRRAFLYGWIASSLYMLLSSLWLWETFQIHGGLGFFPTLFGWLLISFLLALFVGGACALARALEEKTATPLLITLPVCWVLFLWLQTHWPLEGWPWMNITQTQAFYPLFIQIADFTGFYGVAFVLVWVNTAIALSLKNWRKEFAITTTLLLLLTIGYGFFRLHTEPRKEALSPRLKVALLQPNIPQVEKRDPFFVEKQEAIFKSLIQGLGKTDLIVWPETAYGPIPEKPVTHLEPRTYHAAEGDETFHLLGLVMQRQEGEKLFYTNSSLLVNESGNVFGHYDKTHLVPFGEYVPWRRVLTFMQPLAAIGDFEPGEFIEPLPVRGYGMGNMICGEDIFPNHARKLTQNGARFFVNQTNDAWYGFSSQPWQHLAQAVYRSVENRRVSVRSTNTGISGIIDSAGRVVFQSPLFAESRLLYQVPMLSEKSFYTRFGDVFVLGCFLYLVWLGVRSCRKKS